jgi:hypothetical protein
MIIITVTAVETSNLTEFFVALPFTPKRLRYNVDDRGIGD